MSFAMIRPFLPHIAFAALLLFGIWKIDQNGYSRAGRDAERIELREKQREAELVRRIETMLTRKLGEIDRNTGERIAAIDSLERTIIQPAIVKEIARDPRYSDPAAGISRGMLDAINTARAASNPAAVGASR